MAHPFQWIRTEYRTKVLWVSGSFTILMLVVMTITGAPLKTPVAGQGIISFELAHTLRQAQVIMDSWNPAQKMAAAYNLGIDYLFMLVYAFFLSFFCFTRAEKLNAQKPDWARLGRALGWLQLTAGVLDAMENYMLYRLLFSPPQEVFAQLAFWFASFKFAFVLAGIVYLLIGYAFKNESKK
jgi:hypothetical protein